MSDLSAEQRENVHNLYNKMVLIKNEQSGQALHKKLHENAAAILEIIPNDRVAIHTNLTCLIKLKQFEAAIKFLTKVPGGIQKELVFEHAYILHRHGQN